MRTAVLLAALAAAAPSGALAASGDNTLNSTRPMVLVLNPGKGAVVGSPFLLQVHVATSTAGGPVAAMAYTTDGTAPSCAGTLVAPFAVNPRYAPGTNGVVYETQLTLAAGNYVLRVCARNGSGAVEAPTVTLTVGTGGDGNLLVRDNSNQLCTDCHALQSHTSAATSNKYGSWAVACRDCHVPHGTRNIYLMGEQVTPPDYNAATGPKNVYFSNTSGDSGIVGATSPGSASYANADNSGPCQVCHTRTQNPTTLAPRFRFNGNADTHYTGAGTQNCASCHSHVKGFAASCTGCHGDAARTATVDTVSPPIDTCGNTTGGRVGAHQAHLNAGALSSGVACANCHVNPPAGTHPTYAKCSTDPAQHAIMTWGGISQTVLPGDAGGPITATFDATTQTCANYCHGNFKNGNRTNTVTWNGTAACGSCHGVPPGGTHPQNSNCGSCHTGYTSTTVVASTHVNGAVDVVALTCTTCHGTTARANGNLALAYDANQAASPPVDSHGATTGVLVGGHLAHANPSTPAAVYKPIACTECHPNNAGNTLHSNGTVDVTFAAATGANLAAFAPTYVQGNGTTTATSCTVYCHGQTLPNAGGTARTPSWNGGPAQGSCGTCHGSPPPIVAGSSPHPQNLACGNCHNTGAPNDYTSTSVGPGAMAIHIDGTLQRPAITCYACHGNGSRTAVLTLAALVDPDPNALLAVPPVDSHGNTTSGNLGVGAHIRHVNDRSNPLACAVCHGTLPVTGDTSHVTGSVPSPGLNMPLNALATQGGGLLPSYAAGTCSNVYCHGAKFSAGVQGTTPSPSWTATLTCGSCHASPPVDNYHKATWAANVTTCVNCHGTISPAADVTDASGNIVANGLHVNGTVDLKVKSCDVCHGNPATVVDPLANTATNTAAPPRDISGNTARTAPGVGAHQWHVNGSRSKPQECAECHDMSQILFGTNSFFAHADGVVNITWGPTATAGGVTPGTYTLGSGAGCSATYCHGNFPGGNGAGTTAAWTTNTASPQLACTSCHGDPPPLATTRHPLNTGCAACHPAGYSSSAVVHATHVDGTVQKPASGCTACHGQLAGYGGAAVANTSSTAAPGSGGTGVDVAGNSATTFATVGAHARHLTGTTYRATPISCAECHAVPATGDTSHATGTGSGGARATLTWGTLATGAVNSWSGAPVAPAFTGSTTAAGGNVAGSCASTYCHGNFRNGSNVSMSWTGASTTAACGTCHGLPPGGTHPALTAGTACSGCHPGYTGTVGGTTWAVDPATHLNGVMDGGGHGTGWKEPNQHGLAALNQVLVANEPQGGVGFAGCTSCHTAFGAASGVATSSCNSCHANPAAVGGTYTTGTYPNHVNWQTECTFCHGGRDNATGAPPRTTLVISSDLTTPQLTTDNRIGAHTSHVGTGGATTRHSIANSVACTGCHQTLWASATDVGHVDKTSADVFFNAVGGTANPGTYTSGVGCATNYCHGNFAKSGVTASPAWTGSFGTTFTLNCGSCHGQAANVGQPVYPHPQNTGCASCHGTGYASNAVSGGALATHVNGTVNRTTAGCTSCHGDLAVAGVTLAANTVAAAPGETGAATSVDSTGQAATTSAGVGVHRAHLANTTFRATPIACGECHALPPSDTDTTHATGTGTGGARATLTFGTLATTSTFQAHAPSYAGSNSGTGGTTGGTCSNTYCHAPRTTDTAAGLNLAPSWTAAGSVVCGDCHGIPPVTATHPANSSCGSCHPGYTSTTVNTTLHMNGVLDGGESSGNTPCWNCHKTDPTTGAAYQAMATDTTVHHHVLATDVTLTGSITQYPLNATTNACVQCHADHNVFNPAINTGNTLGRGANLRSRIQSAPPQVATGTAVNAAPGDAAPGYYTNTDFLSTGNFGICVSCHSAAQTKDTVNQKSDGTTVTPVIAGATYQASAHQYAVAGQITQGSSAFQAQCMKCHSDPPGVGYPQYQNGANRFVLHTNTDRRLRNPLGMTQTDALEENFCYRCHSTAGQVTPGGGAAKATANRDYFNATAMSAASQDVYTEMQKGTAGAAGSTQSGSVLYFRNSATADEPMPNAYQIASGTYTGDTTFRSYLMTPGSAGTAQTSFANTSTSTTNPRYLRMMQFASPRLATGATVAAGAAFTIVIQHAENNANFNGVVRYALYRWTTGDALGTTMEPVAASTVELGNGVANTPYTETINFTTNTAATFAVGDRFVLELEVGRPSTTNGTATFYWNGAEQARLSLPASMSFNVPAVAGSGRHDVAAYSGLHLPSPTDETGAYIGNNKHVECEDCHSPHGARAGLHAFASNVAGAVLTGAPAVQPTLPATNWATTTTVTYAATTVGATTPEAWVCFRCHSNNNGAIPNDPAGTPTGGWATGGGGFTNVALEFNTANQSYHPVLGALPATDPGANGSSRLTAAQLVGSDHTWTPGSLMTCTDCHNADAASPAAQGPHGSAIRYMLAGTNKAWPFTVAGVTTGTPRQLNSGETGLGTNDGLFCRNCHPSQAAAGSTNALHTYTDLTGGQHGGSVVTRCVACHIRIPHGGKVSRLMLTSAAPARYQTSGVTVNFVRFVKGANATSYGTNVANYFGSTCGQHSGGASGGEAW